MTTLDKNDFTERIEKLLKSVHNFGYNNGLVKISKKPELRYIEATQALKTLIGELVEEILEKKFDVSEYIVRYGDGEVVYHNNEAMVKVSDVLKLREEQRQRKLKILGGE